MFTFLSTKTCFFFNVHTRKDLKKMTPRFMCVKNVSLIFSSWSAVHKHFLNTIPLFFFYIFDYVLVRISKSFAMWSFSFLSLFIHSINNLFFLCYLMCYASAFPRHHSQRSKSAPYNSLSDNMSSVRSCYCFFRFYLKWHSALLVIFQQSN